MTASSPERPRAWLALAALSLLFFQITAATFTSLGVVLPAMIAELKWSWSDAGLGFTLLAVACGLASLAPTLVIRTLGARATLVAGGLVLGAGLLAFAHARGVKLYLFGAVLAGIGFALAAIIPGAFILARAFQKPAFAIGLYFTAGGLGGAAGPLLAHLGLEHAWRGYWLLMACLSLALAALAALSLAPAWTRDAASSEDAAVEGWGVREALISPAFWIVAAAYTAYLLCGVTVNYASVQHLSEHGWSAGAAAGLLAAENLANALARAVAGGLAERVGPRRLAAGGLGLQALGVAALAGLHGWTGGALYVLGSGAGYGVAYLATAVLLLAYFGRRRNLELFSIMCLISTAAAVGPWAAGFSHDHTGSFAPALWLFAGLAVAALVGVLAVRPPVRRKAGPPTAEIASSARDLGL